MLPLTRKDITPKILFDRRRNFLKLGAASVIASSTMVELMAKETLPLQNLKFTKI